MRVATRPVTSNVGGEIPEKLKPYAFHGLQFSSIGDREAVIEECPFCGEEGKFGVTVDEGLFRCFRCDSRGNAYTFLAKLWDVLDAGTKADKYEELAADRKLLGPDALVHWGIVWNQRRREWAVPGRNLKGEVRQLYRYARVVRKRALLATPGIGHQMSGINLFDKHKPVVYLCYAADTEILTTRGWVLFKNLAETDEVAAYHRESGKVTFETPRARQVFAYNGEMLNLKSTWCDLLVTPDHRMLFKYQSQKEGRIRLAKNVKGMGCYPTCGVSETESIFVEDVWARLLVAFVADGCIRRGFDLEFSFCKDRKKKRLKMLLQEAGIPFKVQRFPSLRHRNQESILVDRRVATQFLQHCPNKTWTGKEVEWPLSARQAMLEELQHWDGDFNKRSIRYFTSRYEQAEVVSRVAALSGFSCWIHRSPPRKERCSEEVVVGLSRKLWRGVSKKPERIHYIGNVYCVTVSTGLVVVRRNGKTIVAGNCEGVWDAMALWELLGQVKRTKEGLVPTGNPRASLLAEANVLSVPGSSVFAEPWKELFAGKDVALLYDNDHPKEKVPPAGLRGMERVAGILSGTAKSVSYLKWGDQGFTLEKPSGWDLRDALTEGDGSLERRVERLQFILNRVAPVPEEWLGKGAKAKSRDQDDLAPVPCSDYRTLTQAWRKALKWTDGLDHALAVMLSCVTSTKAVGDQLWAKVISPPAGGKSTLAEALSVNKKYVIAKSTIRGFHSGFKEGGGDVDCSLVSQVMGKTLVTKDGDTLLQSPNLTQILSEARDLYDSTSRTHYRNNMSKDYTGVRMTWILCGTSSLRQIDSSELGERFLDCVIMEGIDDDLEDEVLMRVGRRAKSNLSIEAGDRESSHHDPRLAEAMRLTGGYVGWLRENAASVLPTIDISDDRLREIGRLGKFVAYMRARPSIRQEESAEREFASRLVSQLTRLAGCLAMVLNHRDADEEVMRRVKRVALDTARGMTLSICSHLVGNPEGLERQSLVGLTGLTEHKVIYLTRFMRQIGMVEPFTPTSIKGIRQRQRWRLTPKMRKLYETVMGSE